MSTWSRFDAPECNVQCNYQAEHRRKWFNFTYKCATPSSTSDSRKTVTFEDDGAFNLYDINLTVPKGHLIGIMGKVGSGKSLLLDGILSEITKVRGTVAVNDVDKGFAYVKQSPWLQRGTIRDNILFGNPYDYNKYKTIFKACALTTNLNSLPNKDLTVVGDAGNTLSGGQKTRISLARAIYAEKDIYLLDDVLATLDPKVASYVFEHVILGLLTHKTRLLCTHQTQYLIHADLVVDMSKGRIINQGQPSEVLPDIDDYLLSSDSYEPNLNIESVNDLPIDVNQVDKNSRDPLPNEELTERGTVRLGVYTCYTNAVGRFLVISILVSIFLMQSSKNLTDLWLSYWVTQDNTTVTNSTERPNLLQLNYLFDDQNISTKYYLTVYAILAVLNSLFTLMRAFMIAYGGIQAAIAIHKQLLKIVVRVWK